jgi:hypothetical protein
MKHQCQPARLLTMKSTLLAAVVVALTFQSMPADARIKRSTAAKHTFMRETPCPSLTAHKKYKCPGFVVDHVKALACGGADTPENMQWQTLRDSKLKDKWERKGC